MQNHKPESIFTISSSILYLFSLRKFFNRFFAGLFLLTSLATAEDQSRKALWLESARQDFANRPAKLLKDSEYTFLNTHNIVALLLAGNASIIMHNSDADNKIADHFRRHPALQSFEDESLDVIGSPFTHIAASGIWYILSAENQDDFNKKRAWTMLTALSVSSIATFGLKAIRQNDTPNGQNWAWPSAHTSSSFTAASVLHEFYGLKVGVPAYIMASLVAYRMMDTGDHWASDRVFGATLGWVVGHTIATKHKSLEVAGFSIMPLTPIVGTQVMGINLIKQF
jgi:membrane-associated phospholipid phosphatase